MRSIRNQLSMMSCALLSQQAHAVEVIDNAWEVDSGLLFYSEQDRVDVAKVVVTVKGKLSDSDVVKLKTIYDTMTGATPSGAVRQSTITFTGVSGGLSTSGQAPSLAKFDDTRLAQHLEWERLMDRGESYTVSGNVSVENDYRAFGLSAIYNKEFNNKTMKLTAGLAGSYDEVFRVGGNDTPEKLSRVTDGSFLGDGQKTTMDGLVGLTQVINKRTVAQYNLGVSRSQGYLTDPYKLFSIVDNNGIEYDQFYESRPGSRTRFTLSGTINHQSYPDDDVIHASYRYYSDNWGIDSHTMETSIEKQLENGWYFMPNFRYMHQGQADFYRNSFTHDPTLLTPVETVLPEHMSSDYRLDTINSFTLGATYGLRGKDNDHVRFRMQLIRWDYGHSEYDTLNVIVLNASYGKKF